MIRKTDMKAYMICCELIDHEIASIPIKTAAYEFEGSIWELIVTLADFRRAVSIPEIEVVYIFEDTNNFLEANLRDKYELFDNLDKDSRRILIEVFGNVASIPDNVFLPTLSDNCIEAQLFDGGFSLVAHGSYENVIKHCEIIHIEVTTDSILLRLWVRGREFQSFESVIPKRKLEGLDSLEELLVLIDNECMKSSRHS